MSNHVLKDFISLSGAALEEEDRIILGKTYFRKKPSGILRVNNEHPYQYICWKASMARWDAVVEAERHDLELRAPNETGAPLAVFEMKRWMSPTGKTKNDISEIQKDVNNLRRLAGPAGFLIVFSANPLNSTEEQLRYFEKEFLGGVPGPREDYRFPTVNLKGEQCEFWIAGWQMNENVVGRVS